MSEPRTGPDITYEDIRAALRQLGVYVDVTEEDLMKIFELALRHSREKVLYGRQVSEIVTRNAVSISPEDNIGNAARLLSEYNVSGLPVVDENNRVVGIITEKDILCLLGEGPAHNFKEIVKQALGGHPNVCRLDDRVKDRMTSPAITARLETDLSAVMELLRARDIRMLPVVDAEGRLTGIISGVDIIRLLGER